MLDRVQIKLEAKGVVRSAKVSAYLFTLLALALVFSCAAPAQPAFTAQAETNHRVTKEVTVTVDGKPCTYTVDVTYDLVVNDKVHYYEDNRESN